MICVANQPQDKTDNNNRDCQLKEAWAMQVEEKQLFVSARTGQ